MLRNPSRRQGKHDDEEVEEARHRNDICTHWLHVDVVLAIKKRRLIILVETLDVIPGVEGYTSGRHRPYLFTVAGHGFAVLQATQNSLLAP
ncbi:hypothetical protein E2C01_008437 [Portunus trituberculatus]|uniref:Uncharacterized protein n=1 Tax=Portunus trituberculatus TaxID=210409 RepID=A0A5B7D2D5_PORTR|nr:hypothetical protein [Portunus trituberculatus]